MKKLSIFIAVLFLVSQGNVSSVEAQTNKGVTSGNMPVSKTESPLVDGIVGYSSQLVCSPGEKAVEEKDSSGNYFGTRCVAVSVPGSPAGTQTHVNSLPVTGIGNSVPEPVSGVGGSTSGPVSGNSNTVSGNKYEEVYLPKIYSSSSNRNSNGDVMIGSNSNSKGDDTILPEKPIEVSSKNSNGSSFLINKNGNTYSVTESIKSTDEDKATDGATSASKSESIEMISSLPIKIKADSVTVVSVDGEKEVIKPSVAKEAVKDFSSKIDDDSIKSVELKNCEGSSCKSSTSVYEMKAEKKVKFLAVIPMRSTHVYTVDASTKEVLSEKAPWYSWMTW